jgi:hypothetical protein
MTTTDILAQDPIFQKMHALDLVRKIEHSTGWVTTRCPFHLAEDSIAFYIPAGLFGKAKGTYGCLHPNCTRFGQLDFEKQLDLIAHPPSADGQSRS